MGQRNGTKDGDFEVLIQSLKSARSDIESLKKWIPLCASEIDKLYDECDELIDSLEDLNS